ncbi:hypothetical protein GCM10010406_01370 [Streptomyces thermolineatus]|uniref:Uncharacterized protein n=1 Tax=Streptomyces thermolineatus TaxID=44033 RepID=A0ABN3KQH9_9ACTN
MLLVIGEGAFLVAGAVNGVPVDGVLPPPRGQGRGKAAPALGGAGRGRGAVRCSTARQ